jgi:hypothetical protein
MKGKTQFSRDEANRIIELIEQKLLASQSEQKNIRNQLRNIGFYYSNFSNKKGYNVNDFNQLIVSRNIEIKNEDNSTKQQLKTSGKESKKEIPNIISDKKNDFEEIDQRFLIENKFVSYSELDNEILNCTGFYLIKLKLGSKLPDRYQNVLDQRKNKYIYIGKAEGQTLKDRLEQEIEHKSPGTFFRSIGTVLEKSPIKGHLKGKKNQNNFKFSESDTLEIIEWLKMNVEISIIKNTNDFNFEKTLINKYCPLLNDTHNPKKLLELKEDKAICRKIARG